jgi:hypothetical protein
MSELSYEAIIAEMNKVAESMPVNNPYVYSHADMHTAIAAGREAERERIIDLINDSGSRNYLTEEQCLELIDLINGHNIPSRFRDISNGE